MNDTQSSCNSLLCVGEKAVGVNPSDTIITKSPISVSHQSLSSKTRPHSASEAKLTHRNNLTVKVPSKAGFLLPGLQPIKTTSSLTIIDFSAPRKVVTPIRPKTTLMSFDKSSIPTNCFVPKMHPRHIDDPEILNAFKGVRTQSPVKHPVIQTKLVDTFLPHYPSLQYKSPYGNVQSKVKLALNPPPKLRKWQMSKKIRNDIRVPSRMQDRTERAINRAIENRDDDDDSDDNDVKQNNDENDGDGVDYDESYSMLMNGDD